MEWGNIEKEREWYIVWWLIATCGTSPTSWHLFCFVLFWLNFILCVLLSSVNPWPVLMSLAQMAKTRNTNSWNVLSVRVLTGAAALSCFFSELLESGVCVCERENVLACVRGLLHRPTVGLWICLFVMMTSVTIKLSKLARQQSGVEYSHKDVYTSACMDVYNNYHVRIMFGIRKHTPHCHGNFPGTSLDVHVASRLQRSYRDRACLSLPIPTRPPRAIFFLRVFALDDIFSSLICGLS